MHSLSMLNRQMSTGKMLVWVRPGLPLLFVQKMLPVFGKDSLHRSFLSRRLLQQSSSREASSASLPLVSQIAKDHAFAIYRWQQCESTRLLQLRAPAAKAGCGVGQRHQR